MPTPPAIPITVVLLLLAAIPLIVHLLQGGEAAAETKSEEPARSAWADLTVAERHPYDWHYTTGARRDLSGPDTFTQAHAREARIARERSA